MRTQYGWTAGRIALCATMVAGLVQPAGAQTATPSPAPTPAAFSARAHAAVTVVTDGRTVTGDAQLGMAQRGGRTRIDLLSLKTDAFPIPPIALTVVLDRGANTLTAWNDATKLYHVQSFVPTAMLSAAPKPSGTPRPSAAPAPQAASPFGKLDLLSITIKLTGHTTTAGIPTTGLSFDMLVAKKGETATSHVTATTQIADEYALLPVSLDVSVEPGATPFRAKLAYAVDELTRDAPPAARFEIPRGYTDAGSLVGVVFPRRPSPAPSARAH